MVELFPVASSSSFVQSQLLDLGRAGMADDASVTLLALQIWPTMAVAVTQTSDATGSPNLAVHGRRHHSRTLLRHGRRHCWLSRSGRPWSSAWLIPAMLFKSWKRCFLFLLFPSILCFFSFFLFLLSPFLLHALSMAVCNFERRLLRRPLTAVIAAARGDVTTFATARSGRSASIAIEPLDLEVMAFHGCQARRCDRNLGGFSAVMEEPPSSNSF